MELKEVSLLRLITKPSPILSGKRKRKGSEWVIKGLPEESAVTKKVLSIVEEVEKETGKQVKRFFVHSDETLTIEFYKDERVYEVSIS